MCLSLRVQGVFCDEGSPADGGQLPFFGFAHVQLFFAKRGEEPFVKSCQ